ncbi:MAG: exodeoxyribonuclease VII large subunit [Muribaculaceae bacterium]
MSTPLSPAISLREFNARLGAAVNDRPGLSSVWVTAETADLRVSGGHCYMELIEKDPAGFATLARLRAVIWSSRFAVINCRFADVTGMTLRSDIKVMVCVTASYHPVYGLSAVISDIDPAYTAGDLLRRRQMLVERLTAEGIIDMNRTLEWPDVVLRVAVISSKSAAGYGDFINQLYNNSLRLRFTTWLFPATLQGDSAPSSIIAALHAVAAEADDFDCVVIIRGGGATSDLASFDDYDLAAHVAQFPLPVIVGIGHERDVTILDYVANMRVKTPTAAAEWLVDRGRAALMRARSLASDIFNVVSSRISSAMSRVDRLGGLLPSVVEARIDAERRRVDDHCADELRRCVADIVSRRSTTLDSAAALIEALSPEATLRRGYSITRIGGHAVTSFSQLNKGDIVTTVFADGSAVSQIIDTNDEKD